ncbi:inverse autotransporter beta domain-containing protein [unidentified bacterial endosymbiont]|uniref:inverse autotransporter beta domain-containing protein n=1 Tax=unidentified bacterial endosymbiont TaxID=2355 RepID=UPI00209C8C54|nr:inverse autotransporter beta domain-containing protein [unidentified bacterial endosymbiont]
MQNSWKRLFQRLLFCSPLAILPLQAAPTAINLPELGEPLGRPSLEELLPLPLDPVCSKPVQQQCGRTAASQQLGALTSQWLNQFGQAEIALSDRLSGSALRTGRLALLLPLYQQSHQLILTQWRVLRDRQQTTLDFGIGQRFFNQAQSYWGYNVFYDYHRQGNHGGLGLGLEQRGATRTVAVNGYLPLSGWRISEDQRSQSRSVKGIDLRLQQQLPKYPQLQLNAVLEHYFDQSLVSVHEQQTPRPTAFMLGLDYTPIPLFTTSYAYQLASGGLRNHQLQLRLIYRLGVPWGQQLDPTQVAQSLASNHYALIQRHSPVTSKAQRVTAQSNTMLVHVPPLPAVYRNNVRVVDEAAIQEAVQEAVQEAT